MISSFAQLREYAPFGGSISFSEKAASFGQLFKTGLLKVSVDTMAITALPLDCWLKERLKSWVQCSGHVGSLIPATNHTLWKKQPSANTIEAKAYRKIMEDPELTGLTPKFYKEIVHDNESFIEIQDLLADFPNCDHKAVMDIKIGQRTFLESEVTNSKKRADLYKKMSDIDPNEATPEEREEEAITKLRYMQFREKESSTATLGFRIEGAITPDGDLQKNFKKIKTKEQIGQTLSHFLGEKNNRVRKQVLERLKEMRKKVEKSDFFKRHEVVGSSLLIVHDGQRAGVWMIDFAKSNEMTDGRTLNHRSMRGGNQKILFKLN
uniref:Kinase n=1 Tax=Rhabditophanes sp. KR3021 TaxID=114890 RepID=A0AC35U0T1_9BILA